MPSLGELGGATEELRLLFADREPEERQRLVGPQTRRRFAYPNLPVSTGWLARHRSSFKRLLDAGFQLRLGLALPEIRVHRELAAADAGRIEILPQPQVPDPPDELDEVLPLFNRLRRLLRESPGGPEGPAGEDGRGACRGHELAELLEFLDSADDSRTGNDQLEPPRVQARLQLELTLSIALDKQTALSQLDIGAPREGIAFELFLFPESLAATLAAQTPNGLEESGLFRPGYRTVFVVAGGRGRLTGDYLALLGIDQEAALKEIRPLSEPLLQQTGKILEFRNQRCAWQGQTSWLVPEIFAVTSDQTSADGLAAAREELERLQALLALLFVADETRAHPDGFEIFFQRGRDRGLVVNRALLGQVGCPLTRVVGLYEFAYSDLKPEKLEIVRRTLDRQTLDGVADLCASAQRALAASEHVLGNYLTDRVGEYFTARQQTQDYIRKVLLEVEAATLGLTRSVAENAYKTAGVIAAAVVTGLLKPEARLLATSLAGGVILAYLALILGYYFPTRWQTWKIRKVRFADHIRSFSDLLGTRETDALVANPRVAEADRLFEAKLRRAEQIYRATLIAISLGVLYVVAGGPLP